MSATKYDCEVVVVGTGAGGAVAGAILAESGRDTIIVEEGKFYKSEDHGRTDVFTSFSRMYVSGGSTIVIGLPPISITLGTAVGGTTAINSSTCFRPPREKVEAWGGPAWKELEPYFERVEKRINAHYVDIDLLGGNWRVLKRGCDSLGIEIKPLMHNVKDCKARGRCQFGCPEGAKQSTDISFIPGALDAGARLLTEHHVKKLIVNKGRVAGVSGVSADGPFEIRAKKTIISMGALRTPVFLIENKIANSSRRAGKGLQIHPATRVIAEFDEIVDGHIGLPQGAFIDKWTDRGVMLEGIFLPPGILFTSVSHVGAALKKLAANYRHLSAFGVMVNDTATGTVRPGHFGSPFLAQYQLNKADAENLRFGIARIVEIYLAAGAKRIFTGYHPGAVIENEADLRKMENAKLKVTDLEVAAFHPLGTCAMGGYKKNSVVDYSLKTHDIDDLYIMDGSVVPGSLGVNPQVTIMGLAMRAAEKLVDDMGK